jgi:AAA domain-containing protein
MPDRPPPSGGEGQLRGLTELAERAREVVWRLPGKMLIARCPCEAQGELRATQLAGMASAVLSCTAGCAAEAIQKALSNGHGYAYLVDAPKSGVVQASETDSANEINDLTARPDAHVDAMADLGGSEATKTNESGVFSTSTKAPTVDSKPSLNGTAPVPALTPEQERLSALYELAYMAKEACQNPRYRELWPTNETFAPHLLDELKHRVANGTGKKGLAGLSESEIEEELSRIVDGYLPVAVVERGQLPAEARDPYEDRHALDAYEVGQALTKERKGYTVEGLVREGATALISAVIGAGKTTLMLNICRAWAIGGVVLGRQCQQSKTLVVVSPKEYDNWAETVYQWGLADAIFIIESPKSHFGNPQKAADWFDAEMRRLACRTFGFDTLFDFYGHSPTSSASEVNREVMNEQAPLLMVVRQNNWSGVVSGHAPKSEAKAIEPRDPEEAFSGANAWAAQHRMRIALRRRDKLTSIISGRGGYGDDGILDEQLLAFTKETRLVELGGPWSQHVGAAALPVVTEALKGLDGIASMAKLVEVTGRGETFIRAGIRAGRESEPPTIWKVGKGRSTRHSLQAPVPSQSKPPKQRRIWGDESDELDENGISKGD